MTFEEEGTMFLLKKEKEKTRARAQNGKKKMDGERAMTGFEARKASMRRAVRGGRDVVEKCRERNEKLRVARLSSRKKLLETAAKKSLPDQVVAALIAHHREVERDLERCERTLKAIDTRMTVVEEASARVKEIVLHDVWMLRKSLCAKSVTSDFTGFRFPGETLGGDGDASVLAHWFPAE